MPRRNWTHDELLLAFNLYCKLPFGLYHRHNPDVIALSKIIDRTPSAVAMKLTNLASLDPVHQQRGVKGLSNTSKADRMAWEEFTGNWEETIWKSEILLAKSGQTTLTSQESTEELIPPTETQEWEQPLIENTQVEKITRVRVGQNFFRKTILANFHSSCCICELSIPNLLIASHIIPWRDREDLRLNPHNGLCLCALHDKAFDTGYITIDGNYRILVSKKLEEYLPEEIISLYFFRHDGNKIMLPDKFVPDSKYLDYHTDRYFLSDNN